MNKVWIVFLMRTDTAKDAPGMFVGVYPSYREAKAFADLSNKEMTYNNRDFMYVVHEVEMGNSNEGSRLWFEGSGY